MYGSIVWGIYKYPLIAEKYFVPVSLLFLLLYFAALTQLVLAGHYGAKLVHVYGIHAQMNR